MKSPLELFIALVGIIIACISVTIAFLNWVHPFNPVGPSPFQQTGSPAATSRGSVTPDIPQTSNVSIPVPSDQPSTSTTSKSNPIAGFIGQYLLSKAADYIWDKAIARYRDNGDGTIIDTQTNLMWADRDNGSDIDWPSAQRYVANYTAGGYRNWRLPSISELRDLVDINLSLSDTVCKLPNGIHAVHHVPAPILLSCPFLWSYETQGVLVGRVVMSDGSLSWLHQGNWPLYRVLPVRSRE